MLKIKIRPLQERTANSANPASLLAASGMRMDIYANIRREEFLKFGLVLIAYITFCILACDTHGFVRVMRPLLASGALASFATILLIFGRRIATSSIFFIPIGGAFPTVNEDIRPKTNYPRRKSEEQLTSFDFHFVVRETEPNVAERLRGYVKEKGVSVIRNDTLDKVHLSFLSARFPSPEITTALAKHQSKLFNEKRDLWPVARLIIGRVLYQRPKSITFKRKSGEEAARPESKGAHYYLAYKLNLLPVAYWFVLIAVALIAPNLSVHFSDTKHIRSLIQVLILLWAIWTLLANRSLVERWHKWLAASGTRPLGNLPLFLYTPKNDVFAKWEELDEHDFCAYLDEYLLDTSGAFQLIFGLFTGTAVTFAGLLI